MQFRREFTRRFKSLAAQLIGACIAGYFIYHAVQGDRGILAWLRVNQQLDQAHQELVTTTAEREALEQRVALLSNSSLDLDMLEERARVMLNFSHPDDVVMFLNGATNTPSEAPEAQQ
jgi:cell division protein FtsB